MDKFLGEIRSANLLLALVSAAVLLFALSPNDVASLRQALTEVQAIRHVDYSGTDSQSYALAAAKQWEPVQYSYEKGEVKRAFDDVNKWQTDNDITVSVPLIIPRLAANATLSSIVAFFEEPPKLYHARGQPLNPVEDFSTAWSDIVTRIVGKGICIGSDHSHMPCQTIPRSATVGSFIIEGSTDQTAPTFSVSPEGRWVMERLAVEFPWSLGDEKIYDREIPSGLLHVVWHSGPYGAFWIFSERVPLYYSASRHFSSTDTVLSPKKWLRATNPRVAALVFGNRDKPDFLPVLQDMFWINVANKTPEQAAIYLKDRIDSSKQSISLFGLTVDQRLVMLVGPAAIFVASLYLLTLIRMLLISIVRSKVTDTSLELYPWIGLFSDPLSLATSCIAVLVLPPLSSLLLVVNYWNGLDPAAITAVIATTALVVLSAATGIALRDLRRRFASATLPLKSGDDS